ncbi:hypothetical protein ACFOWM_03350 [Ferruginibacter yonginensis]|uniref:Uncharacterized protein n=1 Tax=Ferruginibacter yonginensis TaxID=1310416 RepID=A0ABV8QSL8_9BACT
MNVIYESEYIRADGKKFYLFIFQLQGLVNVHICDVVDNRPQIANILHNYITTINSNNLGALVNEAENFARNLV